MSLNSIKWLSEILAVGSAMCVLSACGSSPKGDALHGKELYAQCVACHKMQENFIGPKHCGLVGRAAGSASGFVYSDAMKSSGLVWSTDNLDKFLMSPISFVEGTKMGFAGFTNPKDRADVITYLQQANDDPAVCPRG